MVKLFFKRIWNVWILGKYFVLSSNYIHQWDCEWADNIKNPIYVHENEINKLVRRGYKKARCCFK